MNEPTTQNDYEAEMNTVIFQNVLLRVADDLSEDQKERLSTLLQQSGSEMEVARMLQTAVPNLQEIIKEETTKLETEVQELLEGIKTNDEKGEEEVE